MEGACMVLCDYTVAPASDASTNSRGGLQGIPSPESRQAWRDRKTAQADRIEDGINAILAHLGHPVADSIATGKELLENIEAHARNKRSRPASSSKASASKRSA